MAENDHGRIRISQLLCKSSNNLEQEKVENKVQGMKQKGHLASGTSWNIHHRWGFSPRTGGSVARTCIVGLDGGRGVFLTVGRCGGDFQWRRSQDAAIVPIKMAITWGSSPHMGQNWKELIVSPLIHFFWAISLAMNQFTFVPFVLTWIVGTCGFADVHPHLVSGWWVTICYNISSRLLRLLNGNQWGVFL